MAELEKQKQYLLENKKIVAMTKESEDKHVKDLQLQLDEISSSEEELLKKRHHLIALQTEEKRQYAHIPTTSRHLYCYFRLDFSLRHLFLTE